MSSQGDEDMQDASAVQTPGESEFIEDDDVMGRIRMARNAPSYAKTDANGELQLPGGSETAASFEFLEEDHTLGNALRHIIMKNPKVEFCGYSIPHPAEKKMNLRIQTYDDENVQAVLEKGLTDLMDLCDVVIEKFEDAKKDFEENGPAK